MTEPLSPPTLVEPEALTPHLNDPNLRIVQVCSAERFAEGHVPNAIHILPQSLVLGVPPVVGMTPSLTQIERVIKTLNLTEDSWVVALDDEGGGWAGRLLWTLEMVGFSRWSLMNGGLWAWSGSGQSLAQPVNDAQMSAQYAATDASTQQQQQEPQQEHQQQPTWPCQWASAAPSVDARTIEQHLDDPNWVIWDARSAPEYEGTRQTALRNGHIPGAQHYEWTQAMDKSQDLRLRDQDHIRQELNALGITADKTIITHCQSHHRSGFTWVLGRILGFNNIVAYPGSWSEWGNSPDLPITTGDKP